MEAFIVFWRPSVGFGFGCEFPLLVRKVWTDQINLDEGPEHTRLNRPFEVVGGNHCKTNYQVSLFLVYLMLILS